MGFLQESQCEGNLDCPIPIETEKGWEYKIPSELITALSWDYLKAFGFYEKQWYPNGNIGWMHEGNKFVQAISIIDREFSKIKRKNPNNENK